MTVGRTNILLTTSVVERLIRVNSMILLELFKTTYTEIILNSNQISDTGRSHLETPLDIKC